MDVRKRFAILALFALVLGVSSALAVPHPGVGDLYDRRDFPKPTRLVDLPSPTEPENGGESIAPMHRSPLPINPGPLSRSKSVIPVRGSAIVTPRGGTFATPQQRADREIRRLIRILN